MTEIISEIVEVIIDFINAWTTELLILGLLIATVYYIYTNGKKTLEVLEI